MVQKENRTQRINQAQIVQGLENIYISPLESCNLTCKHCYTKKTSNFLSNRQILRFIKKYQSYLQTTNHKLKSIIFCGGEVFTLPTFPKLINTLTQKDIFITIITNGTIDRLDEINHPKNCQILVSIDGPQKIHDKNRGSKNFNKSIQYIKHAQKLKFHTGIMFLITKDSYLFKDSFPSYLSKKLGKNNSSTQNITYLTDRNFSLTNDQSLNIKQSYSTFPSKNFGCFQLSLQSNGNITGCCESSISLGNINNHPNIFVKNFIKSLSTCLACQKCNGCIDTTYLCGYQKEFHQNSCQNIVKIFNKTPYFH